MRHTWLVLVVLALAACGEVPPAPAQPASPSAGPPDGAGDASTTTGGAGDAGAGSTGGTGTTSTTGGYVSHSPSGGGTTPDASDAGGVPNPTCTPITWKGYAKAWFVSNCGGCHGSFTVYQPFHQDIANITARIGDGSMPKGSTLPANERASILQWIKCGAP